MAAQRRKGVTGWQMFVRSTLPQIKHLLPKERMTVLTSMWKELSSEDKQEWRERALDNHVPNQFEGIQLIYRGIQPPSAEKLQVEGLVANLAGLQEEKASVDEVQPEKPKANKECVICMDTDRHIIFLPCKHLACCLECTNELAKKECPLCKAIIKSTVDLSTVHVA